MTVRVCQVSFSVIENDPRVLRCVSALEAEGYDVIPVGYGNGLNVSPMTLPQKIAIALRKSPSKILPRYWAQAAYWWKEENRKLYSLLMQHRPKIIHAHDWNTLPAAARAAKELDAKLIYDSHEFAVGRRQHRVFWRLVYPAYIEDLESYHIHSADHVITVSQGIARTLHDNYHLANCPTVIRSTPDYVKVKFRKTNPKRILVHYHGIFTQGRGLRHLIKSVALWPQHFQLRLTGWGQPPGFEAELKRLANQLDVENRITFARRTPYDQLIAHASEADIGICFWSGDAPQQKYSLPNKVFEYTMAGLMLITGPGVELEHLIDQHECGICLMNNRPETLSQVLGALTIDQVNNHKRKALMASAALCWENEKEKLLTIYSKLDIRMK